MDRRCPMGALLPIVTRALHYRQAASNAALRAAYDELVAAGDAHLHYVDSASLFGPAATLVRGDGMPEQSRLALIVCASAALYCRTRAPRMGCTRQTRACTTWRRSGSASYRRWWRSRGHSDTFYCTSVRSVGARRSCWYKMGCQCRQRSPSPHSPRSTQWGYRTKSRLALLEHHWRNMLVCVNTHTKARLVTYPCEASSPLMHRVPGTALMKICRLTDPS